MTPKNLSMLSEVTSNNSISFLSSAASPGSHCPLHTALAFSSSMKGLSTLVIGTAECSYYSRAVLSDSKDALHWCYVLEDDEIVFGAREGISLAIDQMIEEGAKYILLIATCIPELIGEDLQGIATQKNGEGRGKVLSVSLPHFKSNSFPNGTRAVFGVLVDLITSLPKKEAVNILGWHPNNHGPVPEIVDLLEENTIPMCFFSPEASLEEILDLSSSILTINLTPLAETLSKELQDRFGIPQISLFDKYNVQDILMAYREVFDILGLPWNELSLEPMAKEIAVLEEKIIHQQKTTYVLKKIGMLHPYSFMDYMLELGLKPLLIHLEDFSQDDKNIMEHLVKKGINPPVCHMVHDEKESSYIVSLNPDLIIGQTENKVEGFRYLDRIRILYGFSGLQRTQMLLRMLHSALEEGVYGTV